MTSAARCIRRRSCQESAPPNCGEHGRCVERIARRRESTCGHIIGGPCPGEGGGPSDFICDGRGSRRRMREWAYGHGVIWVGVGICRSLIRAALSRRRRGGDRIRVRECRRYHWSRSWRRRGGGATDSGTFGPFEALRRETYGHLQASVSPVVMEGDTVLANY